MNIGEKCNRLHLSLRGLLMVIMDVVCYLHLNAITAPIASM